MHKTTRRILFYTSVLLFVLVSYVAILYAQGYKYSFSSRRFLRTGTITLHLNASANIYFNDRLHGKTTLLTNSYSIDRLLPGQYSIRAQRDDYSTWQKNVTVYEGLISDFPNVLILPQDDATTKKLMEEIQDSFARLPIIHSDFTLRQRVLTHVKEGQEPELLATNARGFALSGDGSRVLWWTPNEIWVEWLRDTSYQPLKTTGNRQMIVRSSLPITQAGWFRGSDHIVFESSGYRIVEVDLRGGENIIKI